MILRKLKLVVRKNIIGVVNSCSSVIPSWFFELAGFKKRYHLDFEKTFSKLFSVDRDFKFIQIGANDGVSFDGLYDKVKERKSTGLVVEPSPYYYKLLVDNYKEIRNVIPVNKAIHKTDRKIHLYELSDIGRAKLPDWGQGIGSFNKEHLLKFDIKEEDLSAIDVEAIPFSELIEHPPGFASIDYLQVDTEGYDAEVINSIPFDRFNVRMIKFESVNLSSHDKERTKAYLSKNGFVVFEFTEDTIAILKVQQLIFK